MIEKENPLYPPLVGTLSVLFVASAIALSIMMIVAVIGPFRFMTLSDEEASISFGLWTPNREGIETQNRIRAWREVAPRERPLLESASLAELRDQHVRSIAIPDARSLSSREIAELRSYIASGGGVMLTGSIGVSGPNGIWQGYDQMKSLLHADEIRQISRLGSASIAAAHRGPLSASLSPGSRIPIIQEPGMPAIEGQFAEIHWDQAHDEGEFRGPGASRRVEIGSGRIAWLATGPENASGGASTNWHPMLHLIQSAIAWSAGLPNIEILPWPAGAAFAARVKSPASGGLEETTQPTSRAELLTEIEWAERTGGLARIELDESVLSGGDRSPSSLKHYALAELRKREAWIARDGEIQSWSRIHTELRASFQQRGPRRVQIDVTNEAREDAKNAVVRLHVNRPVVAASIAKTRVMQKTADVRFEEHAEWIDIILPKLPARSSHSYYVDFELASDHSGKLRDDPRLTINGQASRLHVRL